MPKTLAVYKMKAGIGEGFGFTCDQPEGAVTLRERLEGEAFGTRYAIQWRDDSDGGYHTFRNPFFGNCLTDVLYYFGSKCKQFDPTGELCIPEECHADGIESGLRRSITVGDRMHLKETHHA